MGEGKHGNKLQKQHDAFAGLLTGDFVGRTGAQEGRDGVEEKASG